ncbi:LytR/AlgR family response regulator transcription factor [Paenibacillus turpanensis]|uniref:LytR/AlgR family response regulator transcription factor n=1 Tax=Paenibacillus turpanensis TaxID=2689078 RepID=UPI00140BA0E0|nr:LytTR family DNA-binding domain-containing protein [Paenibacillus turpanensis]
MIAEDERLAREELLYLLSKVEDVELLPYATNGHELLELAAVHCPDVVFLDIHMPGLDGVKTAHKLLLTVPRPFIVFATAYDQYAVEAFRLDAADYLLKPYDEERLQQTLSRIRALRGSSAARTGPDAAAVLAAGGVSAAAPEQKDRSAAAEWGRTAAATKVKLLVDDGSKMVVIDPQTIGYAVKEEKLTQIHTMDGRVHAAKQTLQDLEDKLVGYPFFRTHRSYLVNVDHIHEIEPWFNGAYNVILNDSKRTKVPVSRVAAKELLRRLQGE